MKLKLIIAALALTLCVMGAVASATAAPKVNICHNTSSEGNPWNAIQVDSSAVDTHKAEHGDFLYNGPLKNNGHPENKDKAADKWCEENVPQEEDPEEPTDVCPNIDGPQATVPEGMELVEGVCVPIGGQGGDGEETPPAETPTTPATETPVTQEATVNVGK